VLAPAYIYVDLKGIINKITLHTYMLMNEKTSSKYLIYIHYKNIQLGVIIGISLLNDL